MAGSKSYIAAGTQLAYYGIYNSIGVHQGGSATLAQGAAGNGMKRLKGIQRANPGPVESESVDVDGDDGTLGAIEFPPDTVPEWIVESGVFDLDIQAALQTTAVEQVGDVQMGVLQPNNPVHPDIVWIYNSKSKKKDAGVDGLKAWSGYIVPISSTVPLGREAMEGRTAGADRYKVTAQVAGKKPWGVTIVDADLGTDGAPLLPFSSENPVTMHVFKGDGAVSEFGPLDKTPVSVGKTVIYEGNGQLLTPTVDYTVDVATKLITKVAGALDTDVLWQVFYEFSP